MNWITHQPLSVSLQTLQIQVLNSNRLSVQPRPQLFIYETFVYRSKPAFAEKITRREALSYHFQLCQYENVKVWTGQRYRQILRQRRRAGVAQIQKWKPQKRALLCNGGRLFLRLAWFLLPINATHWNNRSPRNFHSHYCRWREITSDEKRNEKLTNDHTRKTNIQSITNCCWTRRRENSQLLLISVKLASNHSIYILV